MGLSVFPSAAAVATQPIGTDGIIFAGNATQGSYTHPSSITPGNYLLYPNFSGTPVPDLAVILPASGTTVDSSYNPVAPTMVTITSTETALNLRQSTITRWSTSSTPFTSATQIAFGAGLYVVTTSAASPNNIFTSPDLVTWTARTSGLTQGITGIQFGNGIFIAVSNGNNGAAYSSNGTTWTVSNPGGTTPLQGLSFANGTFHVAGQNASFTTTNGVTWTSQGLITGGSAIGQLGSANGMHFVFNPSGTTFRTSTTGASGSWTVRTLTGATNPVSVTFGNSLYVVGEAGSTINNIWTSPDLTTWTARTFPTGSFSQTTRVTFGNGKFVALVNDKVYESFDGITWSGLKTTIASSQDLRFFNNRFINVAAGLPINITTGITAQYALYRTAGANLN
jgi:hypothetical protein